MTRYRWRLTERDFWRNIWMKTSAKLMTNVMFCTTLCAIAPLSGKYFGLLLALVRHLYTILK